MKRIYEGEYLGEVAYQLQGVKINYTDIEGVKEITLTKRIFEDWKITTLLRTENIDEELIREIEQEIREALKMKTFWKKGDKIKIKVEIKDGKKYITLIDYREEKTFKVLDKEEFKEFLKNVVEELKEEIKNGDSYEG